MKKRSQRAKVHRSDGPKTVIGWREVVSIPEWGISGLEAKVDTGAKTSALDVSRIEDLGDDRVRFEVVLDRRERTRKTTVEARIVRRSRVRSSQGRSRDRLMVRTNIQMGSLTKSVEFGLVSRRRMICRALIGRSALEGDFLVDCSRRRVLKKD